MGWGSFSEKQQVVVAKHVAGHQVHDLGAGDLLLSHVLLAIGSTEVVAVDNKSSLMVSVYHPKLKKVLSSFNEYREPINVAFLSWPLNRYLPGLLECVTRANKIIYLGKNTEGSVCGTPELYRYFRRRKLLEHVPHRRNTLLVLGGRLKKMRNPTYEERAGLDDSMNTWPWRGPHDSPLEAVINAGGF